MPTATRAAIPSDTRRVHIIGAGPVGLFLAALLQSVDGLSLRLYEKRSTYARKRMVRLASYLVEDSPERYRADPIDGDNVDAVFDPQELEESLALRRSMPSDLMSLLREWTAGFCPLSTIEHSLSRLIDARVSRPVERIAGALTVEDAMTMVEDGDIVIDCTGCKSLLRDHLAPRAGKAEEAEESTVNHRLEFAIVVTFLYGQQYACNEYCKYYKNIENPSYKFIPSVDRTFDDHSISHVTGIINITPEDYEAMPSQFDGEWLRQNFPAVARSMDRFIAKIKDETHGEVVGDLDILRIPLNLYHARNYTSRRWRAVGHSGHPFAGAQVFLVGDSAIGSPYFQSISLGFECAMFLAGLIREPDLLPREIFGRYELYMHKQWLRVYMRSKTIKHNKDLFERVDDPFSLLEKLHIY